MSTPEGSSTPEGEADGGAPRFRPPVNDPWKGFRGVCAGTLILEAIVVLLALPVVATVGGGITWLSGVYLVGLALLMILGGGVQGKPWAMGYNFALQAALIAGFAVHPAIGAVGLLFGAVWAYLLYLKRDLTERIEQGLLPGQRD
ncbi:DUF4233 domain-containing protein [Rhodococcus oryzae]|uniref:DUF4233 domain-containing protein n=1 Tax=Rhodococcus oryzae TaxID=2571143 RepID=UPI003712CA4B